MHIMYRYALYSRDANLIKILQRLVKAYNNRIHSALHGMTPAEVINNEEKEWMLRLWRYPWLAVKGGTPVRAQIDPRAPPLGSFVRIAMKRSGKHTWAKETDTHATAFSHALYQILRYDLSLQCIMGMFKKYIIFNVLTTSKIQDTHYQNASSFNAFSSC